MKALIIYQDFAAATAANAALQNSAGRSDISVRWNIRPWRTEMLKYPSAAKESLIDAADAHLIVIAGRCAHEVPFSLLRWLESWAKDRQVENVALAAISCQDADSLSTQIAPELIRFAREHGLDFITDHQFLSEHAAALRIRSRPVKELPSSPLKPPIITDPTQLDSYRHWGINE